MKKLQCGMALIASLLILIMVTIIALSMFRSSNLLEKISGNVRENQRAFQSAQDALVYAEWWLRQPTSSVNPVACTGTSLPNLQVCNAPISSANVSGLPLFTGYTPPGMTVSSGGGQTSASTTSDVNYSQNPAVYIAYLGLVSGTSAPLYQVTAIGYGGSGGPTGSTCIVQSNYSLTGAGNVTNLGQL